MPKVQNKKLAFGIRNEIQTGNTLELYVLDYVEDSFDWYEWTFVSMVQDVINRVNAAKPSRIIIYINSEGGDCSIGLAIYNYLKYMTGVEIETRSLGMAGSIASVLAQAASPGKRYIAKNGFMVIHKAWGGGVGNADDLRQAADVIDGYTATIVDIYAQKTGKPTEEIEGMIANGDCWMQGDKAVELGFADAIFDDMPSGFNVAACINRGLDPHYANAPKEVLALITSPTPEKPVSNNAKKIENMTWKERREEFLNSFRKNTIDPKAPDLTAAVSAAIDAPMNALLEGMHEDFTAQIADLETSITTSVTNALTTSFETKIKAAVDAAAKVSDDLATANEEIEKLRAELADRSGKETGKGDPAAAIDGVVPIGRWSKSS